MSWTEERIGILRTSWAAGESATEIAKKLGGVTRNAVIGKVHRLGLSGRETPSNPKKRGRPRSTGNGGSAATGTRRRSQKPAALSGPAPDRSAVVKLPADMPINQKIKSDGRVTILSVQNGQCRWPIGNPLKQDFKFCGDKSDAGPYCPTHTERARLSTASNMRMAS